MLLTENYYLLPKRITRYNLVFLDEWLAFVNDPIQEKMPLNINTQKYMCIHNRLLYDINLDNLKDVEFTPIDETEWEYLKCHYQVDGPPLSFRKVKVSDNTLMLLSDIGTCEPCRIDRLMDYDLATINITKRVGAVAPVVQESTETCYEVDEIVDHRFEDAIKFRVRWKGFGAHEDSWEPLSCFDQSECIDDYSKKVGISFREQLDTATLVDQNEAETDVEMDADFLPDRKRSESSKAKPSAKKQKIIIDLEEELKAASSVSVEMDVDFVPELNQNSIPKTRSSAKKQTIIIDLEKESETASSTSPSKSERCRTGTQELITPKSKARTKRERTTTIQMEITPLTTVKEVGLEILKKYSIPPLYQKLFYNKTVLIDLGMTMRDLKIYDGGTIHLEVFDESTGRFDFTGIQ